MPSGQRSCAMNVNADGRSSGNSGGRLTKAQLPTLAFLRQFGPRRKSDRGCGAFRGRRSSKPPASGCPSPRLLAARKGRRNECQTNRDAQVPNHLGRRYFFEEPGGKCLNILSMPLSRFLMFLSELLESVSLEVPLQISCLVLASNRSTTNVPTL
jgi:hypothetical protein